MTVSVQQPFTASVASGATTVFPYGFKVAHADDLSVSLDGVLQTTGYSVTGVGDDAGGDVVFDVAPAAAVKVLRYLNPVLNRQTDYQQFGDWTASVVNNDFDRLWLAIQAVAQNTSRSIKLPVDTADNQEITADAATRANKGIRFDAEGNLVISLYDPDASGVYADAAYSYAETAEAAQAGAVNAKEDAEISATEAAASAASINAANLLTKAGNLSGLASPATARINLGLDESTEDEMIAGVSTTLRSLNALRVRQGADAAVVDGLAAYDFHGVLNATGDAPIFACRAWVNFNGTGTVAIRGSGNVSSITDNGTGDYTVNLATAMPDANYGVEVSGGSSDAGYTTHATLGTTKTVSAFRVLGASVSATANNLADLVEFNAAIFR